MARGFHVCLQPGVCVCIYIPSAEQTSWAKLKDAPFPTANHSCALCIYSTVSGNSGFHASFSSHVHDWFVCCYQIMFSSCLRRADKFLPHCSRAAWSHKQRRPWQTDKSNFTFNDILLSLPRGSASPMQLECFVRCCRVRTAVCAGRSWRRPPNTFRSPLLFLPWRVFPLFHRCQDGSLFIIAGRTACMCCRPDRREELTVWRAGSRTVFNLRRM